jgi:hypothetical protein
MGLKAYIGLAEAERIKFFEKEFTRYRLIPYAIAMNERSFWNRLIINIDQDKTFFQFLNMGMKSNGQEEAFFDNMSFEFSKIASEFFYTIRN